ncbi:hypothetical protein [Sessilibacter sp. MAH2]
MIVFINNNALKNTALKMLHSKQKRDVQKPFGYLINSQGESVGITDQVVLNCINQFEAEGHYPNRWAMIKNKLPKKPFLKLLTFS